MTKDLNTYPECDILNIEVLSQEDDEMTLTRFHNANAIYLYCVTDTATANNIINGCNKMPIKLYENISIAHDMVANTNLTNRVTLRFAVNLESAFYYDEFTMTDKMIKSKTNLRLEQFKSKSSYLRTFNKNKKVIEYCIRDPKCIINVQIF